MKFTLISVGVFIVTSLFYMGEAAWLILLCVAVVRIALSSRGLGFRCVAIVSGLVIFAAHLAGYKFYGSATVHDNRPVLDAPHELASLAAPNIILASDGTKFEVQGVTFTRELLALRGDNLQRLVNRVSGPVLIQADAASPSGVVFQKRCEYWCGNTFFPTFTPRRLPAYSRTDMGNYLMSYKLAVAQTAE